MNTIGYYDYYTATSPQQAWSYNENRDSGYADVGRGGYPTCKAWWSSTTQGLKKRLLAHFEPRTINMMKAKSPDNWEEGLLRWLVSPQSIHLASSGDTYMMGNQQGQSTSIDTGIKRVISSFGAFLAQMTQLPAFDALRQGLPMIHAILLMALIIIIPLVLLLGAYDPKIIITLTFVMDSLNFSMIIDSIFTCNNDPWFSALRTCCCWISSSKDTVAITCHLLNCSNASCTSGCFIPIECD
ncbi:conjugal transfer protein TraG N-terminal domain-containing protein [Proteus mirabilis]|nr:conjugal transfer protein TraG N-terminal domain-containing protein [Proteus mirabilis]